MIYFKILIKYSIKYGKFPFSQLKTSGSCYNCVELLLLFQLSFAKKYLQMVSWDIRHLKVCFLSSFQGPEN